MWNTVPNLEKLNCLKISVDDFNLNCCKLFYVAYIVDIFLVPVGLTIGLHVPESGNE